MPIGRYFLFVGGCLMSLLFFVNWYVPPLAAEPGRSDVDRSIIRIHSQHRWPEPVTINTAIQPQPLPPREISLPSSVDANPLAQASASEHQVDLPVLSTRPRSSAKPKRASLRPARRLGREIASEPQSASVF
jgi:hypothetical protein